jgi:hypothetical protein
MAVCHGGLARVATAQGRLDQAAYHFGAALTRCVRWVGSSCPWMLRFTSRATARTLLDDQAWQHGHERGQRSISAPERFVTRLSRIKRLLCQRQPKIDPLTAKRVLVNVATPRGFRRLAGPRTASLGSDG